MNIDLNKILREFNIDSKIENYGNGHINDTYCTETPKYILQRINTSIFKILMNLWRILIMLQLFLKKK